MKLKTLLDDVLGTNGLYDDYEVWILIEDKANDLLVEYKLTRVDVSGIAKEIFFKVITEDDDET